jgi:hypothetical protein
MQSTLLQCNRKFEFRLEVVFVQVNMQVIILYQEGPLDFEEHGRALGIFSSSAYTARSSGAVDACRGNGWLAIIGR